jgi:hypothetical protein
MTRQRLLFAVALLDLLLFASAANAINWSQDYISAPTQKVINMSLNPSQWPCMADLYNNRYRWNAGAGWTSENTTPVSVNYNYDVTNLCYDTLGYPHSLYRTNGSYDLHHLYRDSSGWHDELIASSIGSWQRIAIGSDNVYHVVYNANFQLFYTKHTSSGWQTPEVIGSRDDQGYYGDCCGDIALDSDNRPHVVHHQFDAPHGIEHVWWDGQGWQAENVEATSGNTYASSEIAVDRSDRVCVLFHKLPGDSVKYACRDRDGWHMSVAATSQGRYALSLCLDYRGLPRAAVVNGSQVSYLQYDGSSWSSQVAASGNYDWPVLALNSSGEPFIAYNYASTNIYVSRPQYYAPAAFSLLDPPNGAWAGASPAFRWNPCSYLADSLSRYELWIDGVYNRSVTPPTITVCHPAAPLSAGWHTWKVVAIKITGDSIWSSSAWSVRVDAAGPLAFNLTAPANSSWTVQRHPTFSWTASSDGESGLRKYQVIIDGFKADDSVPATQTSAQSLISLPDGSHTWNIRAVDNAGNVTPSTQTWTVKVDSTGPAWFNLTLPPSYSHTGNSRPTFVWHRTSDAGVGLRWYQLWAGVDGGQMHLLQDSITDTTYTLRPNQALTNATWDWEVIAFDSLGNKTWDGSGYWTLYVDLLPPLAFNLVSPADSAVVSLPTPMFNWRRTTDASSGLSHYELWIDSTLNVDNLADSFSAPASPLPEGAHRWFVRAIDSVGNVRASNTTRTVFLDWNLPDTFSLASPANDDTTFLQQPLLCWHRARDNGSGIKKYQLWVNGVVSRDSVRASDTFATPASPLPFGSRVPWFVTAYDRAGNSRSSNSTWYINTVRDSLPPSVPLPLAPDSGRATNDTQPRFVWRHSTDDYSGVDHYTLQYAKNPSFAGAVSVDQTDTAYRAPGRLVDTTYYWRARAQDRAGNQSTWSQVWCFEVDSRVPLPPSLLEPVGGVWLGTSSVIFRWSQVTFLGNGVVTPVLRTLVELPYAQPAALESGRELHRGRPMSLVHYVFQLDTLSGFISPLVTETTLCLRDTVSLFERHFFWRVMAFDDAGNRGNFSAFDSFGVDVTPPTSPVLELPPDDTTLQDSVNLVWLHASDQGSGVAAYQVQLALDSIFAAPVKDTAIQDTVLRMFLPETLYFWRAHAWDRAGNPSGWPHFRRFRVQFPEFVAESPWSLPSRTVLGSPVPSPFSDAVMIPYELAAASVVKLAVYDLSGRELAELSNGLLPAGSYQARWNGRTTAGAMLPNGVYVVRLVADGRAQTRKLAMQR